MSWTLSGPGGAAVMRAADAETMASESVRVAMLLDSSATNGAASTVRVGLSAAPTGRSRTGTTSQARSSTSSMAVSRS